LVTNVVCSNCDLIVFLPKIRTIPAIRNGTIHEKNVTNVMYEQFFNFLGLREDPFHVSPDPRFFYTTPSHEAALAELLYGVETRKGFMVLTGEAGTGKTSLLKQILDWLKGRRRSTAYIFHTHVEPIGLLKLILSDFGVPSQSRSKSELISTLQTWLLQRHAAGDLPVLILDEAQALPMQTLDELRLLLNLETPRGKLLQIILSGQPELEETLRLPGLRQLRQRIVFHSRLDLLSQKETAAYISRRLAVAGCPDSLLFPDEVVQGIYVSSRGIPRVVNLLCEHALISAYAERQHVVSPEMVHRVAADFDLVEQPLAVPESELQAQYARSARFPLMQESESSSALDRDSMRWLDQIDFDVSKGPAAPTAYKWPLAGVQEKPAPQTNPNAAATVQSPEWFVQQRIDAPIVSESGPTRAYWSTHRSSVTRFAQNCANSVQYSWDAVTRCFEVPKARLAALFNSAKPTFKDDPAPQLTLKPSIDSQKPLDRPIETLAAHHSSVIASYWRSHRSSVNRFARNCGDFAQHAWQVFMRSFEGAKLRLIALFNSAKAALKKNPVAQLARKSPMDSPKPAGTSVETRFAHSPSALPTNWESIGSGAVVRSSSLHSIPSRLQRGWHAAFDPVFRYVRTVLQSFVRDCQSLFHLATPPTPALEISSTENNHGASRRVLSPVLNWFRQPMTARRVHNHRPPAHPAPRAKA
jgi:general secretion pathway protein A